MLSFPFSWSTSERTDLPISRILLQCQRHLSIKVCENLKGEILTSTHEVLMDTINILAPRKKKRKHIGKKVPYYCIFESFLILLLLFKHFTWVLIHCSKAQAHFKQVSIPVQLKGMSILLKWFIWSLSKFKIHNDTKRRLFYFHIVCSRQLMPQRFLLTFVCTWKNHLQSVLLLQDQDI